MKKPLALVIRGLGAGPGALFGFGGSGLGWVQSLV